MRMSVTRLLSPNPAFLLGREARVGMEKLGRRTRDRPIGGARDG